ncbi:UNVERIFIED_ORG: hypothetical protein E4P37_03420 [Bacillus sp. AZ43]
MPFEPIEPYNVDADDPITRGRLLHAAARGDRRARLTIDEHRREHPPADPPAPRVGAVDAGRKMWRDDHPDPDPDAA